jgi:hypothetical protein
MPFDADIPIDQMTAPAKLRYLADYMETLEIEQVNMKSVHHPCGSAHCAWGWGEVIGLFPRPVGIEESDEADVGWAEEMLSAEGGRSVVLGLTDKQFRYCFGIGYQFRSLDRPYAPADVARHLRDTAEALENGISET